MPNEPYIEYKVNQLVAEDRKLQAEIDDLTKQLRAEVDILNGLQAQVTELTNQVNILEGIVQGLSNLQTQGNP